MALPGTRYLVFFIFSPLVVISFLFPVTCWAQTVTSKVPPPEPKAEDYIIIEQRSAREALEDANHLYSVGKYDEAFSLYNYAYSIAREKSLKKEILKQKKEAQDILERAAEEKETLAEKAEKEAERAAKRAAKEAEREAKRAAKEAKRIKKLEEKKNKEEARKIRKSENENNF